MFYDILKKDEDLKPVVDFIDKQSSALSSGNYTDITPPSTLNELLQKSSEEIEKLAESFDPPDPEFEKSGLVCAVDKKGFREFVRKDIKLIYEEFGFEECLKMTTKELEDSKREYLAKKTEEDESNQLDAKKKFEENHKADEKKIIIEGCLEKRGLSEFSSYKKRYFILQNNGWLLYYDSKKDKEKGAIADENKIIIEGCLEK